MEKGQSLDIQGILQRLPHRYPFVLVDRITEIEPQKRISGIKNITYNEWYFEGLPPVLRIVPALILSEAVAQLGAILLLMEEENRDRLIFFSGIDWIRFRKPVCPGDTLLMKAEILRRRGRLGRVRVEATVDGKRAFDGVMQFALE